MRLYHGSKDIIQKPSLGLGNARNDYGWGFYCTENYELACEWSVDIERDGIVNEYDIDIYGLKILFLNEKQFNVLHWLTILLQNRIFNTHNMLASDAKDYLIKNFSINYHDYDIIIGYRADDSYFSYAQDFLSGTISYEQLSKAIKLGNLGEQVVLISEKAFERIKFVNSSIALAVDYYEKKHVRDAIARAEYFYNLKMKRNKGDLYINQILDEEMKPDDPRL